MIMVPRQFSSLLMTMLPFSLLSITHPFSSFRFCVINHVSAPKLLSLISVTCPLNTRKAHTVNFVIICGILWHPVCTHFSVIQLILDNSVHYPVNVCSLQCQQLNMSVHHTSSVVDMLGAQVCPATLQSHVLYLPVFVVLHILQTPSQLTVDFNWCNTHHTQKSKHISYFKVCHVSNRPSIFNLTYLNGIHS